MLLEVWRERVFARDLRDLDRRKVRRGNSLFTALTAAFLVERGDGIEEEHSFLCFSLVCRRAIFAGRLRRQFKLVALAVPYPPGESND